MGYNQGGFGINQGGYSQGGYDQLNQGFGNQFGNQYGNQYGNQTGYGSNFNGRTAFIRSALSGKNLDVSQDLNNYGDLIVWPYNGGNNQKFQFVQRGQDYEIKSVQSGKVLDVY